MSIDRRDRAIRWPWMAAATVGLATAAMLARPAMQHWRESPPPPPPALRLQWPADGERAEPFGLAIAPDGQHVVYPAVRDGRAALWLRDLATGETRPLPAADEAALPFWSPDAARLAYFAGGRLHVLDVASGADETRADAPAPRGGTWLPSGDLLIAPAADGGLLRLPADGGAAIPFTELDTAAGELSHGLPMAAADGRAVIFHVRAASAARAGVWWAPVDRPAARRRLVGSDAGGVLAGDRLLFVDGTALMAQRIDLEAGALLGRPAMLATPVGRGALGQPFVAAAADGPLFHAAPASSLRRLTWMDRAGTAIGTVGGDADSWDLRVAGRDRVAVTQADPQLGTLDVWAYAGARPVPTRISTAIEADDQAVWSPDGSRLAWVQGRRTVMIRGAQAVLPEAVVRRFDGPVRLWDWSPDGRWLIVGVAGAATRDDLWLLDPAGEETRPLVASPFRDVEAAVSPDGRWIAYACDDSGRAEIYVDSFPAPSRRVRLSLGGGASPRWRRDGRELYFRRGPELHAVSLRQAPGGRTLEAAPSSLLFTAPADVRAYDAAADGARFLVNLPAAAAPPPIQAIVNWRALLPTDDAARTNR